MEIHRIKGFDNYYIDGEYNIYQLNGSELTKVDKQTWDKYDFVILKDNNKSVAKKIHRIVAETFIPNPENKEVVHHIDGNKKNNDPSNLMWLTPSEHMEIHRNLENNPNYGKHPSEATLKRMKDAQIRNGKIRTAMTDDEIGSMIDTSASIEENIKEMERHGVIHSKKRVLEFCERNDIELASERDEKNKKILEFVRDNMDMSIRQIVKALEDKGIKTSVKTIHKMKKVIET